MAGKRIDKNQNEIVKELKSLGAQVLNLSQVGFGCPDILVCHPLMPHWQALIEIKNGEKPPSARKLTPDEEKFHAEWTGALYIINSVDEIRSLIHGLLYQRQVQSKI